MTQPAGYRPPSDPARDAQPMRDLAAQDLIVEIITLHEQLIDRLDEQVALASMGPSDPASGHVTGTGEHDQMLTRAAAIRQAEAERRAARRAALEVLRRVVRYYRHGEQPPRPPRRPRRPRVESIDYQAGGERRYG